MYIKLVSSWFYKLATSIVQYQQNTKYTNHLADHHSGCVLGLKAAGNYLYIIDLKDSNSDKYDRVSNLVSIRRDTQCKKKRKKENKLEVNSIL